MSIKTTILKKVPYEEGELKRTLNGLESLLDRLHVQIDGNEEAALSKAIEIIQEELEKLKPNSLQITARRGKECVKR